MPRFDADVVIVGAGAAGLSLAARLAGGPLRVLVLDRRAGFGHDRTFSGFATAPHPFEGAIERRYRYVAVRDDTRDVVRSARRHPYVTIPSDVFYETALRAIGRGGNVRVELGRDVRRIDGSSVAGWVETDAGVVFARLVLDARGALGPGAAPANGAGEPAFVQRFVGRVVRSERALFQPDRATLMDFRVSQARGPHFVYVLPRSAREALVEDTLFLPEGETSDDAEHVASIEAYLEAHGARGVEVLREERGALPMTTRLPPPHPSRRVHAIGIAGGAAKPSTGYAFSFIQRQADALAARLAAGPPERAFELPPPRAAHTAFLDAVFLTWMRSAPAEVGRVLVDLFERAPLGSVARFLSEVAGPLDHARVMSAMPAAPLLAIARQRLARG